MPTSTDPTGGRTASPQVTWPDYGARVGRSRFLQTDPVEGGCANDYVYVKDPVDETDLDGRYTIGTGCAAGASIVGTVTIVGAGHVALDARVKRKIGAVTIPGSTSWQTRLMVFPHEAAEVDTYEFWIGNPHRDVQIDRLRFRTVRGYTVPHVSWVCVPHMPTPRSLV